MLEVLIAHPGGPFWARKDEGAWSLPKGEYEDGQDALAAALREFTEETGCAIEAEAAEVVSLGEVRQSGGKRVRAWALEGDLDVSAATSNTFELEWPRGSGTIRTFPEVDRVEWVSLERARTMLVKGQVPLLDALLAAVEGVGTEIGEGT
jgi:predicted NUDIX family NTP pyrophosphohydrolase